MDCVKIQECGTDKWRSSCLFTLCEHKLHWKTVVYWLKIYSWHVYTHWLENGIIINVTCFIGHISQAQLLLDLIFWGGWCKLEDYSVLYAIFSSWKVKFPESNRISWRMSKFHQMFCSSAKERKMEWCRWKNGLSVNRYFLSTFTTTD